MSHSIKVLIVEDEELYRLKLEAFVLELGYELAASTDNSEEAIKIIINDCPDVVIMDININGKLNGIEVARKLRHMRASFLFITSLKEKKLYQKAKQTSYIGYLIKPFDEVTLQSTIEYALSKQKSEVVSQGDVKKWTAGLVAGNSVFIKHNSQLFKVFISDIIYLEAKGKLSLIHTKEKNLISNTSLSKLLFALPQSVFMRIHKSYVVNSNHIHKLILKNNEILINGVSLPIGRVYKDVVLKRFDIL